VRRFESRWPFPPLVRSVLGPPLNHLCRQDSPGSAPIKSLTPRRASATLTRFHALFLHRHFFQSDTRGDRRSGLFPTAAKVEQDPTTLFPIIDRNHCLLHKSLHGPSTRAVLLPSQSHLCVPFSDPHLSTFGNDYVRRNSPNQDTFLAPI